METLYNFKVHYTNKVHKLLNILKIKITFTMKVICIGLNLWNTNKTFDESYKRQMLATKSTGFVKAWLSHVSMQDLPHISISHPYP